MEPSILQGKFVLLAGSAASTCPAEKLARAHALIEELTRLILKAGAGFVVFASGEPKMSDPPHLPLIFDWAVLREVDALVAREERSGECLVVVVTSRKAWADKLSEEQRQLLGRLSAARAAEMVYIPDEVHTGGNIADEQLQRTGAMVAIGGGKGVTDRAYRLMRKGAPVLPFDLMIGSLSGDGDGAIGLHKALLADPQRFFPHTALDVRNQIASISLEGAGVDPRMAAARAIELIAREMVAAHKQAPVEVVLLTALPIELFAAMRVLDLSPVATAMKTASGTAYWTTEIHARRSGRSFRVAVACIGGPGNLDAAAAVTEFLTIHQSPLVVLAGIAAGIRGKCKLGEVIFSDRVVAYEPAAAVVVDAVSVTQPRPESYKLAHAIQQDIVAYLANAEELHQRLAEKLLESRVAVPTDVPAEFVCSGLTVRLATIASGEKLLRDPGRFRALRDLHGKVEVAEMEAAGVAAACHRIGVAFLIVRGISDFGDEAKDDRFQLVAATGAAIVVRDFVQEGLQLRAGTSQAV